jgi:hypothetical protein
MEKLQSTRYFRHFKIIEKLKRKDNVGVHVSR